MGKEDREASVGKVYFSSQDIRVVLPKMPALGYWEAWMCVSNSQVSFEMMLLTPLTYL